MKIDVINEAIHYLENSIEKFIQINNLVKLNTIKKEKTKYNEMLFDLMFEVKEYIAENSLYKIALEVENEKARLDGIAKSRYFEKEMKFLVTNLKSKK
jgi:hypothetical protein